MSLYLCFPSGGNSCLVFFKGKDDWAESKWSLSHFSLLLITYKTLAKHAWYVKRWPSGIPQAAFPNRSAKTALRSFYSHQTITVNFCHFTRRQTCSEIQRMLSKLNHLGRSRFLSAISTVSDPEIQEKCLFFPLPVLTARPQSPYPPWWSRHRRQQHRWWQPGQEEGGFHVRSSLPCPVGFACRSPSSGRVEPL